LVVSHFGRGRLVVDLGPDDFAGLRNKMAAKWGPSTLGDPIQRIRVLFRFSADNSLIRKRVVHGQGFSRPSSKTMRPHRLIQRKSKR
jgi:hypothetical protein